MRMRSLLLALLSLAVLPYARAQYTTISAAEIQDVTGAALGSGYFCLTPVNSSGAPTPFAIGGGHGQVVPTQKCYAIYQGAVTSTPVPDTSLTVPAIGYQVTILDAFNHLIVQYSQPIKPSGSTFSFDTWQPTVTATVSPAGTFVYFGAAVPTTGCTAPSFGYTTAGALYDCLNGAWIAFAAPGNSSGSGSTRVVYTSQILGTLGDASVAPGSSAASATDRAAALNAALAGGNIHLIIDGQYAIGSTLTINSNTQVTCLPGQGLIMKPAANAVMWMNADQNAATTADTTGGFLVSNLGDHDIDVGGDGACTFNLNSTESATGSNHKTSTTSALWISGTRFLGVQNLHVSAHWYDSPTYTVLYSNIEHGRFEKNWVQHPSITPGKNTDGIHGNGPVDDVIVSDTHCTNTADDCVAFNADDGNETKFGDGNAPGVSWPGWQQGPITNGSILDTYMDAGYNEIRLLSVTERIDNVVVRGVRGTAQANAATLYHEYGYGLGNFGNIRIEDFDVTEAASQTGRPAYIYVGGNFDSLSINGFSTSNPAANFAPVILVDGSIGNFSASGWNVFDKTGTDINLIASAATVQSINVSNLNWYASPSGVGTHVSGAAPSVLNVSSYTGPTARIMPASGYAPASHLGDAFAGSTATAAAAATVVPPSGATITLQSLFNEHTSGLLVGTAPAITSVGATWLNAAAGTPTFEYLGGAGNSGGGSSNNFVNINTGATNETVRVLLGSSFAGNQLVLRMQDSNNFVAVLLDPSGAGSSVVYNIIGGGATAVCSLAAGGNGNGLVTAVLSGATMNLTYGGQTVSCPITGNTTGTYAGFNVYNAGTTVAVAGISAANE